MSTLNRRLVVGFFGFGLVAGFASCPSLWPTREPGQELVALDDGHRRVLSRLAGGYFVEEKEQQDFLRSLVHISCEVAEPISIQDGLRWAVRLTGANLRELRELVAEQQSCSGWDEPCICPEGESCECLAPCNVKGEC